MGSFGKKKREDEVLQQDRSIITDAPGRIFVMRLLFRELCELPDQDRLQRVLQEHLGESEAVSYDKDFAIFTPKTFLVEYDEEKKAPLSSSFPLARKSRNLS
ncbi:MAG: hypothetical protein Q4A72_02270 [Bacillota bacterium]|nr:hypothetical protein [Bacillota bacterium]